MKCLICGKDTKGWDNFCTYHGSHRYLDDRAEQRRSDQTFANWAIGIAFVLVLGLFLMIVTGGGGC